MVGDEPLVDVCTTTVVVEGASPSGLTCPSDATVEADGFGNFEDLDTWLAGANADNEDVADDFDELVYGCGQTGSTTVTWWLASGGGDDDCGGPDECSSVFTIVDTTPPLLDVDTTPIVVEDVDCLGEAYVVLPPASADDGGVELDVTSDAPDVFPVGKTTVTYTATDDCGNTTTVATDVTVLNGAGVEVLVFEATVGRGSKGGSSSVPLGDASVGVYDTSPGGCVHQYMKDANGLSRRSFETVVAECEAVNAGVTDEDGVVLVDVPPGRYVVIAGVDLDGDGLPDQYLGRPVGKLRCGNWKSRELTLRFDADGNRVPGAQED
jgi:hypothetical protein